MEKQREYSEENAFKNPEFMRKEKIKQKVMEQRKCEYETQAVKTLGAEISKIQLEESIEESEEQDSSDEEVDDEGVTCRPWVLFR